MIRLRRDSQGRGATAGRRRRWVARVLTLLLPSAVSVSLAFNPPMHHAPDCPMSQENQGAPTVLSSPVTTPPVTERPVAVRDIDESVCAVESVVATSQALQRPRSRGPPSG